MADHHLPDDLAISVAVAEGISADPEETIAVVQHVLCAEAAAINGPMACKYTPFKPGERDEFELFLRHLELPGDDILEYLELWDALDEPVAVVHAGQPIIPVGPRNAQWN